MVAIDARADHVGSLLRPDELKRARERHAAGELDAPAFKAIEDAAVREVVALQEQAGCPVVTDGELRRDSFQSEFTAATTGVEGVSLDAWLWGDWHSDELGDKRVERPAEMAVTAPLVRRRNLAAEEFSFLRAITDRVGKVTLPSPTLFGNLWTPERSRDAYPRFDDFMGDVVASWSTRSASSRGSGAATSSSTRPTTRCWSTRPGARSTRTAAGPWSAGCPTGSSSTTR